MSVAAFVLPPELSASEPPEARGVSRDGVRLLVASPDGIDHAVFRELARFLREGDLVVVNTFGTLAAAVDGTHAGRNAVVHFSSARDDGTWIVELRRPDGSGPILDAAAGDWVAMPAGRLLLVEGGPRLWIARAMAETSVERYLERHGRPIAYGYLNGRWPVSEYQTVFAREAGSAEMPSAGRPFTDRIVTDLVTAGIGVAPVLLHTGVSSLEAHEPPQAERFRVPAGTARAVNETHRRGGRVLAVGTTVTRAIETAVGDDGTVAEAGGWTDLVLGPGRPARVVDGLITGWHAPDASHLLLLEAVAGRALVRDAYEAALAARYRWHEFGDSCLLLP